MTVGDRIKAARETLGLTQGDLGNSCGVTKQTVFKYENNIITNIPFDKLELIAKRLNVSVPDLMGWEERPPAPELEPMPKTRKVPLLGTIACGEPILADENIEDHIDVPDYIHCDFTLRCKGDSMVDARIYDGDIVCIRQQSTVENGEIAAVLIDNEATLKRIYYRENTLMLMPENSEYEPIVYVGEQIQDVRILGKATHFISAVR